MKTLQASEEDDSDNELPAPIVLDDLPQRIRVSSNKSTPKRVVQQLVVPPAASDFLDLGISPSLIRALKTMSIKKPTPVQAACIPPLLAGK